MYAVDVDCVRGGSTVNSHAPKFNDTSCIQAM